MSLHRSDITIEEGLKVFDEPAKRLAKLMIPKIIDSIVEVQEHPNKYSIDLIGYQSEDSPVAYIEVETSHSWKTVNFPWKRLSYLEERKGRYLYKDEYLNLNMYFVMFNKDFTSFAITDRNSILKSPVESHVRTWRGKEPEKFRMIDRKDFDVYIVKDLL
jgi:hypothetical protein